MSMKDARARGTQALAKVEANPGRKPLSPSGRPLTSPGALAMVQPTIDALTARAREAEMEASVLRARMENNPGELAFDQFVEVPGRRRRLPPPEFDQLRQNLEQNPLVHPIAVRLLHDRKTADGRAIYEVIAGHNRLAILRLLDRRGAPVRVLDVDAAEAEDAAFWSDLLQPSLPDYEKFLGLKQVQARHGLSDLQLSQRSGVDRQLLNVLFAYDALPDEVLEFLRDQPDLFDAGSAVEIRSIVEAGGTAHVLKAIAELAAGRISLGQAMSRARQEMLHSAPSDGEGRHVETTVSTQIHRGSMQYCQVTAWSTHLHVEFDSEHQLALATAHVTRILAELAGEPIMPAAPILNQAEG